MSIAKDMLAELEWQAPYTRRFLERLPEDKLTWKPHPKSMTAGQLALHLATIPIAITGLVQRNPAAPPAEFVQKQPESLAEILKAHDEGLEAVRGTIGTWTDEYMGETWVLKAGDKELMSYARAGVMRALMLNHWYQHRGQFSVYLRLLDVPVPTTFGPSADENPFAM